MMHRETRPQQLMGKLLLDHYVHSLPPFVLLHLGATSCQGR